MVVSERASQRAFFGVSALLFAASAAVTIVWCASMSAMGEMRMPGRGTMSMAWMRMPGQTWPGAAASFLGVWVVMMVAMMLPSSVPMLWRYRQAVGRTGETRLGRLTALVGVGYFFVWTVFGTAAFPLGVALAAIEMWLLKIPTTAEMLDFSRPADQEITTVGLSTRNLIKDEAVHQFRRGPSFEERHASASPLISDSRRIDH